MHYQNQIIKASKAMIVVFCGMFFYTSSFAQVEKNKQKVYKMYIDSFQKNYVQHHEIVPEADKKYFNFYAINNQFCFKATFSKIQDSIGFIMKTVNNGAQTFYIYGTIQFTYKGVQQQMYLYQSKMSMQMPKYKYNLFLPFLDATSGDESYGGGRYIDILTTDIINNTVIVDFNKCYNPYCAYASGYKCPIPPKENILSIAIKAGEKQFGKSHH